MTDELFMNMTEEIKIDGYEPNYEDECINCGQSPTVLVMKDGKIIQDFEMCGLCVFGTAKALNVEWWNGND